MLELKTLLGHGIIDKTRNNQPYNKPSLCISKILNYLKAIALTYFLS